MIEQLIAYFKRPLSETTQETPEGICPNCWGKQEYGGQIRTLYADRQIDVNNREANYAFIQKFVVKYLDGIQLKKGNSGLECTACEARI